MPITNSTSVALRNSVGEPASSEESNASVTLSEALFLLDGPNDDELEALKEEFETDDVITAPNSVGISAAEDGRALLFTYMKNGQTYVKILPIDNAGTVLDEMFDAFNALDGLEIDPVDGFQHVFIDAVSEPDEALEIEFAAA